MAAMLRAANGALRRSWPRAAAPLRQAPRAFAGQSWEVTLNYQDPPPPGKRTGRYIFQEDKGDVVDELIEQKTTMYNGREMNPPAELDDCGFSLKSCPTAVKDFRNDEEVVKTYYEEMRGLIKKASGADRVLIFDHTIRESGNTNLNASAGGSAAPVPRVHCDYTADRAPRRLMQLATTGVYSHLRKRTLTEEDFKDLATRRFAFINVWRSISDEAPVERMPLAVADTRTTPKEDQFLYELIFPDRTGENYSLRFSDKHKWYYYPKMAKDECLVFKVYDKHADGPRFVFHTAFEDPHTTPSSPTRKSIEIRAVAFFDCEAEEITADSACRKDLAHM